MRRYKRVPKLDIEFPTEQAIRTLPKYVILAFSARCARRFLPLMSTIKSRRDDVSLPNLAAKALAYLETGKDEQLTLKYSSDMPLTAREFHPEHNFDSMIDYLRQHYDKAWTTESEPNRDVANFFASAIHLRRYSVSGDFEKRRKIAVKSISEAKNALKISLADSTDRPSIENDNVSESRLAVSELQKQLKQLQDSDQKCDEMTRDHDANVTAIFRDSKTLFCKLATSPMELVPYCEDFLRVVRLSEKYKWTDETRVPPEVFGRLWPYGTPAWAQERHDTGEE